MDQQVAFDPNVVCPVSGGGLVDHGDHLASEDGARRYALEDGFYRLFAEESATGKVTEKVLDFYSGTPFPNYNDFDSVASFIQKANAGVFAALLRQAVPMNGRVLEVGCGTAQLSNFLAATTMARIYAADLTPASLRLGIDFAQRQGIEGIRFLQMNLFRPCIRPASMDIVISNGALHHTADTKKAFMSIAPLVKPGGHIIIGLYNKIGRLRTDLRRHLYKAFGERMLFMDPHLRNDLAPEKRRAWIEDQYLHPSERKHSMSELLTWFHEAGFDFVSSIPQIVGPFQADLPLLAPRPEGTALDRVVAELGILISHLGGEGGLYIMIAKRRG